MAASYTEIRDDLIEELGIAIEATTQARVLKGVKEAVRFLLRGWDFPDAVREAPAYTNLTTGIVALPADTARVKLAYIHEISTGDDKLLKYSWQLDQPAAEDVVPDTYWISPGALLISNVITDADYNLYVQYYSKDPDLAALAATMYGDYEDIVRTRAMLSLAPRFRKPELIQLYTGLWADLQANLSLHLHKAEWDQDLADFRVGGVVGNTTVDRYGYSV